jgi:glycosyltransferase involved in cell wall biosynthesis
VSSKGLSKLALQYGVNPQDIYRAPVGADLEEFSPKPGNDIKQKFKITGKLVLYVGQLSGAQYLDIFIEAANIVLHRFNGVQFMVVGGGFREEGLRSLAYKLGIEDKVLFVGAVPHADICAYIAAADICVASFKDTKVTGCKSPLKIVEYMSLAKPIVANNVGEVRNMLGGAGILVPPADARQLAKGVLKLLEDPQLGRKLGNLCLKRVQETYNWVNTASSILSAYQSLQPGQMSSRSAVVCDE